MCARVARQFIGDWPSRAVPQAFEQFFEETLGCSGVASALHQDIQYFAFLIHRSPQVYKFPVDLAECFVEVPRISTVALPVTKAPGVLAAELQAPQPNRFMRDHHTALDHLVGDREVRREPFVFFGHCYPLALITSP